MGNKCPVILCYGVFGFDNGEIPIDYWSLHAQKSSLLEVHLGSVGPISSFWDRACELIAHIKGLRVD